MSNKHLIRKPRHLVPAWSPKENGSESGAGSWFYEEPKGLLIVTEPHSRICGYRIAWAKLRAALARKDRREKT